ncbi:unnamed protein product [Oikopleura dioica]|uniref:DNA replication licensing factor MCM4 n=1 Tax=Oikopleura dioica TaxID=34765 RepID=E4YDU4_OIKDI|nr:unnamed protein product [Oikopleura dioica]
MDSDQPGSSQLFQRSSELGRSEVSSNGGRMPASSNLGMSEFDMSSPLNYGTPSGSSVAPGSNSTPMKQRPDVGHLTNVRQFEVNTDQSTRIDSEYDGGQASNENRLVIWGTDVCLEDSRERFKKFLLNYKMEDLCPEDHPGIKADEPFYFQKLVAIEYVRNNLFFNLDSSHLKEFDPQLYRQLVNYPSELIPILDMATNEVFYEKVATPDAILEHQIQVRPFNVDRTKSLRSLDPNDIDQLVTIRGMVIRATSLVPEMSLAFFKCAVCNNEEEIEIVKGRINEPGVCNRCQTTKSMRLIHNRCKYIGKQIIKLQEAPEEMPAGETPHSIPLHAYGNLVDAIQPGDRVNVTGIFRAGSIRVNPRNRNVKSVYRTHIDTIHFDKKSDEMLKRDEEGSAIDITPQRIEEIVKLSEELDIYDTLANSIAPSIFGNEDIKKGILLQLVGACEKNLSEAGRGKVRSEIHVLLCGDPGTSKSQLLSAVNRLVPRGQYTSGKGSSEMRDQRASDFVVGADADDWMDDGRDVFDDDDEPFQEDAKTKKQKKKMAKFASGSGNIAAMILKQAKNSKTKTKAKDIKMHDDDDLDAIMNEIDDGNVSMKVTPRLKKSKKSKKPQAPAITFNSSPEKSSKKRVLKQRVQNPTKRPKLDENVFKREAEAKQEYISDNDDELPDPGDVFGDNDFDEDMSEDENRIPKKEPSSTEISSKLQNISMEEEKSVINHVKEEPDSQIDWNATKTCVEFDKEEDIQYPVDENCLNLYWLDAYETQYNKSGKLYLTGRANVAGELKSCCLIISNIPHVVYILPRENSDTGDVYEEIGEWMDKNKVDSWKAKPMKKKNFFGGAGVPPEAEYLRVEYGPKNPLMSSTMKGAHFSHVFQRQSAAIRVLSAGEECHGSLLAEHQLVFSSIWRRDQLVQCGIRLYGLQSRSGASRQ